MIRAIRVVLLAIVMGSAAFAVPVTSAHAEASCSAAKRSVNCDSTKEAEDFAAKHCSGSDASLVCPGIGRDCAVQDDGILCTKAYGTHSRKPSGGIAAGAGGTSDGSRTALILAGLGLAGAGALLVVGRRRRAGES
jgi:hypothetical protein